MRFEWAIGGLTRENQALGDYQMIGSELHFPRRCWNMLEGTKLEEKLVSISGFSIGSNLKFKELITVPTHNIRNFCRVGSHRITQSTEREYSPVPIKLDRVRQ